MGKKSRDFAGKRQQEKGEAEVGEQESKIILKTRKNERRERDPLYKDSMVTFSRAGNSIAYLWQRTCRPCTHLVSRRPKRKGACPHSPTPLHHPSRKTTF
jgi:hypothetical protein